MGNIFLFFCNYFVLQSVINNMRQYALHSFYFERKLIHTASELHK
jgi:hypothetical protein